MFLRLKDSLLVVRMVGGAAAMLNLVRSFSKKRGRNLRKIDPKVPREEAVAISAELYRIIKENGPLSVSSTWNHAKVRRNHVYLFEMIAFFVPLF